jgi:hypothetical protein
MLAELLQEGYQPVVYISMYLQTQAHHFTRPVKTYFPDGDPGFDGKQLPPL